MVAAARERGVLVYSSTGCANGVDGDTILLGPPFVVTDAELERIASALADAIEAVATPVELIVVEAASRTVSYAVRRFHRCPRPIAGVVR